MGLLNNKKFKSILLTGLFLVGSFFVVPTVSAAGICSCSYTSNDGIGGMVGRTLSFSGNDVGDCNTKAAAMASRPANSTPSCTFKATAATPVTPGGIILGPDSTSSVGPTATTGAPLDPLNPGKPLPSSNFNPIDMILGRVIAIIGVVLGILLQMVSIFFKIIFNMIAKTLMAVLAFNNFTGEGLKAIDTVWKAMRDLSNMFFIVVLLIVAVGTMLRIEKYNYKQLLPKLLIMAVLINFSRTIAGFFIDISQVIMLTFFDSINNDGAGAGTGNFQLLFAIGWDQLQLSAAAFWSFFDTSIEGPMLVVAAQIMSFMYLVTGTTMMFTILGMLVFRIVALWVLIMFSPLAFFLSTFPQGEEYSGMWWKQFSSNVIIGPVLAFFLWLALLVNQDADYSKATGATGGAAKVLFKGSKLATSTKVDEIIQGLNDPNGTLGTIFIGSFDLIKFVNVLLSFTILSVGMMVAQQIGSAGAKMVGEAASTVNGWGMAAWQKPVKFMGGAAANWVDRSLAAQSLKGGLRGKLAYFSPTVWQKAYTGYMQEEEKQKYTDAAAMVQDTFDKRLNMGLGTGGVPAGLSWFIKKIGKASGKVKTDEHGNILNADENFWAGQAQSLDVMGRKEFNRGHTGLARKIAVEELVGHEISLLKQSELDKPGFGHHLEANRGGGNPIRSQAYLRYAGTEDLGEEISKFLLDHYGRPLLNAQPDTDRQMSAGVKRSLSMLDKNPGVIAVVKEAEAMVRDPEAKNAKGEAIMPTQTGMTEDERRATPEFQAAKAKFDAAKTPEAKKRLAHELGIKWQGEKGMITGKPGDKDADDKHKASMDALKQVFKDFGHKMVSALGGIKLGPDPSATNGNGGFMADDSTSKPLQEWIKTQTHSAAGGPDSVLALGELIELFQRDNAGKPEEMVIEVNGNWVDLSSDDILNSDRKLTQKDIDELYAKLKALDLKK